jgi:exodeoxyribonuclease-3
MLVATWNVNSIRARLERVLAWLEKAAPDVVCLQELKTTEADFPYEALEAAGYRAAVYGQKTYNGVAVLSREAPDEVLLGFDDAVDDPQARLITARFGERHVLSAYAPNGKAVGSPQWAYKLEWFRRLRTFLERHFSPADAVLLCGDLNVAPEDRDVAFPDRWRDSVLFHPEARHALAEVTAWGLIDTIRLHDQGPGPFSWWDYRHLAFPKGNGLRIDHILATRPMADRCTDAYVDRNERKGHKPSDHAPVLAVFED